MNSVSATPQPLYDVLEATGYLTAAEPVPNDLSLEQEARDARRRARNFQPNATWRSRSSLKVYFKYEHKSPRPDTVAKWRQEVWNEGFAPLLWVVSPDKVDIYNGFARPKEQDDADAHRIGRFKQRRSELRKLDMAAGRLAMETGRFWQDSMGGGLNRNTSVDRLLLRDIAGLARELAKSGMDRSNAQSLIGRSIFAQYLVGRRIVTEDFLENTCGCSTLSEVLRHRAKSEQLFDWLRDTFNGDMFPSNGGLAEARQLGRVANFLDGVDADDQTTLFPYQFDIIPVELVSSIYEQFAQPGEHAATGTAEKDVHYTRLSLVSLVLDEVLNECTGDETVLDLTCGSGVFLVEALRRLVDKRAGDAQPTRELIRETLYEHVFGMDISEAAVHVAAFSLYLTALELDPGPEPPDALTFQPLIGNTLFTGDVWDERSSLREQAGARAFDVIVGNPPWSYSRTPALQARRESAGVRGSRGTSLDFLHAATGYSSPRTRFGLVLGGPHFFGLTGNTWRALRQLMTELSPVTLVNLSNLSGWLFPMASMPGIVLFARQKKPVGRAKLISAYQVPWTPDGKRTHTFHVAPSDGTTLPLEYWQRRPEFLKAAFFGGHQDADLLDQLFEKHQTLEKALRRLGTKLSAGLTPGKGRDARFLHGLPFLEPKSGFSPFVVPAGLPLFSSPFAKRPTVRDMYSAPLLLVKDAVAREHAGRVAAAVADTDIVFTKSFFGARFDKSDRKPACMLAGILGSSLAAWFFLMTGSDYGIWRRRVKLGDVKRLRVPDVGTALRSDAGQRIVALVQRPRREAVDEEEWQLLDEAVLDLYGLSAHHRIIVRDGLTRAGWQWREGEAASVAPARAAGDVKEYARVFASAVQSVLQAGKRNSVRAEVYDLSDQAPLRVVRFVLESRHVPPVVDVVPCEDLRTLLSRLGESLDPPLTDSAVGAHEVQCYGREEIVVVKPAARRHWMAVRALEDASQAVIDSLGARRR